MPQVKKSAIVCDFLEGSRNAINFAGDIAIDASIGIGIGAVVAALPETSIPAIIGSSIVGESIISNLFTGLTDDAKSALHGFTSNIVPDACKSAPIVIPMGSSVTPQKSSPVKTNNNQKLIVHKHVQINNKNITNILINLGVSEDQLQQILQNHSASLTEIEKKLDKVLEWQKNQDKHQNQQAKFEQYQSAQALCGSLSELGRVIKCKELAQAAAVVGAVVQLALGIAMCYVNPVMGAALIIGSIANLIGIFSGPGPDPHQLILDQIGKLSEQIVAMHTDMLKLFDQNFKLQKLIIEIIQLSSQNLIQIVKGEIGSFRVNVQASLERIETLQRDIAKFITTGHQQLYLKDFVKLQATVEDFVAGRIPSENIPQQIISLANEVASWSTRHALNPLLNSAEWRQIDSLRTNRELLNTIFNQDPSISANNVIGYFSPQLSNPAFWLTTVNLYTQLTETFWNINIDPAQCEAIQMQGKNIIQYCNALNTTSEMWASPLNDYYKSLHNVQNLIRQYCDQRSRLWLSNCNRNYTLNEKRKRDEGHATELQNEIDISKHNLFERDINALLAQFTGRAPNQLSLNLQANQAEFIHIANNRLISSSAIKLPVLENLNKKRIYQKINLEKEILCAEYLGILECVNVDQQNSITGLDKKISLGKDNKWALILSQQPGAFSTSSQWNLTFNINIKLKDDNPQALKKLTFQRPWEEMPQLPKFWDEKRLKDEVGEYNGHALIFLDSDDTKKHLKNHVELIVQDFNITRPMECVTQTLITPAQSIRTKIESEIKRLRRQIASEILQGNVNDDAVSQAILEQLKQQLITLDYHARQLQHLLYIAGKDLTSVAGKALASKIITSEQIMGELSLYIKLNNEDISLTNTPWLTILDADGAAENKINAYSIVNLKETNYPVYHPKNIAQRGLLMLDLNILVRQALRHQFPLYAHYLSLERYQADEARQYMEAALKEIYGLIERTFALKYQKARFRIQHNNSVSIDRKDYKKFYYAFLQWCSTSAREEQFIGNREEVKQLFAHPDRWPSMVRLKIERGWEKNIAALYQLACLVKTHSNVYITKNIEDSGLINYCMWRDGMNSLLKMISYPGITSEALGLLNHVTTDRYVNDEKVYELQKQHVADVINHGENLYQIIENIVLSPIIDKLLQHYENTFAQLVAIAANKRKQSHISEQALYDVLVETQFAGSTIKLLDSLNADRLLLLTYCEMCLDHFPWQNTFNSILTKEQLLAAIAPTNDPSSSLQRELEKIHQNISAAKTYIVDLFQQIRELINLREALLAFSRNEKNPIISSNNSMLVINASQFQFGFDDLKARLLHQFLGQTSGINGIQFVEEDLSKAQNLKNVIQLIKLHPEITHLGLLNSNLNSHVINECLPEFKLLAHLKILDFSNNLLIDSEDEFVQSVDVDRLCQLLYLSTLSKLILINTGLNFSTFQTMKDFTQSHAGTKTALQAVERITKKKPHEIRLNLSHINLNRLVCVGPRSLEAELSVLRSIHTNLIQRIEILKNSRPIKVDQFFSVSSFVPGTGLFNVGQTINATTPETAVKTTTLQFN